MKLNEIKKDFKNKKPKRVGRGIGSGKGKTAGRGMKGQKSRSGVSINGFEGGQMPIHMRMPKHGFKNPFKKKFVIINTKKINELIEKNKIDVTKKITINDLENMNFVMKKNDSGIKLLGSEKLKKSVNIEAHKASKGALKVFKDAGGSVEIVSKLKVEKKINISKDQVELKNKKDKKNKLDVSKKSKGVVLEKKPSAPKNKTSKSKKD